MSSVVDVKVHYGNGMFLTLKGNSFKKAMFIAWGGVLTERHEPIKIELLSTSKILYAHKETFMAFLQKDISLEQLIESTQCDNVYRNAVSIYHDGEEVEQGALWIRHQNKMILIDDDDYIDTSWNPNLFDVIQ